ncbi:AcrR family transcriptional regulator [Nitrobacteraceae bacterium AZCC 2146]
MARQRDEEKRRAILQAAASVIAEQGLGAPTAKIAQVAGVADGTLFVYFSTKADLFNQLYLAIKEELITAVLDAFPAKGNLKARLFHIWRERTNWGVAQPAKRRALAQLSVSDLVTEDSRKAGVDSAAEVLAVISSASARGPLKTAPASFIGALFEAMAATTMDFMASEPDRAQFYCSMGFAAAWSSLTGKSE